MRRVLDTTVLIDQLRGLPPAVAFMESLGERPACSEVTRIEVLAGLRSAERRPAEALFSLIRWVPLDEQIAQRAGELGRRWRRSHAGIDIADLAVAATAEYLGAAVATANVKHFPMFRKLDPPY